MQLVRDAVLGSLVGMGMGKLRNLHDSIASRGGRFYLSGTSSKARGITEADLAGKRAEFATPQVLLRLSLDSGRTFTY